MDKWIAARLAARCVGGLHLNPIVAQYVAWINAQPSESAAIFALLSVEENTNPDNVLIEAAAKLADLDPTLSSAEPAVGDNGGDTAVTLTGTNLLATTGVTFDGDAATSVLAISDTEVTLVTPAGANGAVDVELTTTFGVVSETDFFTYAELDPPTVDSLDEITGAAAGGDPVEITGTLFTGATSVKFGTTEATSVVVADDETITCVTPAHAAGVVPVSVTTPGGTGTKATAFTYA